MYHVFPIRGANSIAFSVTLCNGTIVYFKLVTDTDREDTYTLLQVRSSVVGKTKTR